MNGKFMPSDGKEIQALMAYYHWISKGIPIYADIPWLGLQMIQSNHQPNATNGKQIYAQNCAACHGSDGQGTQGAPPLWGPESYNDGAGMARTEVLASFAHLNMPKGNPDLTVEQALDVAAYVDEQPRPHFAGFHE